MTMLVPDVALNDAMWRGDIEWIDAHYGCGCCCEDHTFAGCPARLWNGCRGQNSIEDIDGWMAHYAAHHGLNRYQFFGWDEEEEGPWIT